jgi:hypothetical protein
MIWLESQPGGGSLHQSTLPEFTQTSRHSRGVISLSDPFPPPASPNIHQWSKKNQSRYSSDLGSPPGGSLISPRSSVTSEHSPRVAGGWLWWLGI